MTAVLVLPLVIPLLTAVGALLTRRAVRIQRTVSILGSVGLLGVGVWLLSVVWREGIVSIQIGDWPAPFGITLIADLFSALMVLLTGVVAVAVLLYSLTAMEPSVEAAGYHPALHGLLAGLSGAFLTGDLFNLYVWFEVLLIASFVLLTLEGKRPELEGAIPYVTLNVIASALFLTGIALVYGLTGTLNLADLAIQLQARRQEPFVVTSGMLFLVAFGIKAALFPLFFWLPASYHTPPYPVSAVFAGLLTKVGVYALVRLSSLLFLGDQSLMRTVLLVLAGLTMAVGVLGAVVQHELRRTFSWLLIGHIGFMVWGLGLFTAQSLTGTLFYMLHEILAITGLFLVAGLIHQSVETETFGRMGGLYRAAPGLALLFLAPALALAGVPPLSGFVAKVVLVKAGLEVGGYGLVAVALGAELITLYVIATLWQQAFWAAPCHPSPLPRLSWSAYSSVAGLAALTVFVGLGAEPVLRVTTTAADQLLNPTAYIKAVLGNRP